MANRTNLSFTLAILGWSLVKLSKVVLWADFCVLFIFVIEGVELRHWIIPATVFGLSLGLWLIGTSLSKHEWK